MPLHAYGSYVICTSPRSGSTMLCKLLAKSKVAGNPASLFHEPSICAWLDYYKLDATAFASRREALESIFEAAKTRGKGETDVLGVRLQRGSFDFFLGQLAFLYPEAKTDVERIETAFGPTLFIYLARNDKLDQAISYIRAEQTGLWHLRADGTELERTEIQREDGYDPHAIREKLAEFTDFDTAWRSWFDTQSVVPLEISYETLAQQPQSQLARVLHALGADGSIAQGIPTRTSKLADDISRDWRSRFQAETT